MATKFNMSQFKSKIRQAENKQKAALRKFENDVRKLNNDLKRIDNQYKQEVRRQVANHNTQARANRQKLITALNTFNRTQRATTTVHYSLEYRQSVHILNSSYERLESDITHRQDGFDRRLLLDLPEQENTNSLMLYNSLTGNDEDDGQTEQDLGRTAIEEMLHEANPEYGNRWMGAIFALNPGNPDAARHFCSSSREICAGMLDIYAPDHEVLSFDSRDLTQDGRPTRRSKIQFLLHRKSITDSTFQNFVVEDMNNVLQLFHELNSGTHGPAGTFGIPQLLKLKKRVEDSIVFIASIAS